MDIPAHKRRKADADDRTPRVASTEPVSETLRALAASHTQLGRILEKAADHCEEVGGHDLREYLEGVAVSLRELCAEDAQTADSVDYFARQF